MATQHQSQSQSLSSGSIPPKVQTHSQHPYMSQRSKDSGAGSFEDNLPLDDMVEYDQCVRALGDPATADSKVELECEVFNVKTQQQIVCNTVHRDITRKKKSYNNVTPGTCIQLRLRASVACFVYIFNVGSSGRITLLIPNDDDPNNFLSADKSFEFPPRGADYDFEMDENCGTEIIRVFAYTERVSFEGSSTSNDQQFFRDIKLRRKRSEVASVIRMKGSLELQFTKLQVCPLTPWSQGTLQQQSGSLWAISMCTFLTIDDLGSVYKASFNARGKWRIVLLELGVSFATIESIATKWGQKADDCYLDGLSAWLKGGGRSWNDLVEALSSPTVEHDDIAEEIKRKYIQTQVQGAPNMYRQPITGELVIFTDEQLGSGAFGAVFKGSYRGMPCAVKLLHHVAMQIQIKLPVGQTETAVKTFDQECELLKSFQHPNVVEHLSTERHPLSGNTILVIELMDCNLRVYFSSLTEKFLSSHCQLSLSKDVAAGLTYIHSKHIIHRDLCGDNILLKLTKPMPLAKISDFGMSRLLNPTQLSCTLSAVGHRMGYLPPEASRLDEEQYDSSLDVFSLGVIMVQIIKKLETVKSSKERSFFVVQIPEEHFLKPLINKCLHEDRKKRPPASHVYDVLKSREAQLLERQNAESRLSDEIHVSARETTGVPMQVHLSYIQCSEAPQKMSEGQAVAINSKIYCKEGLCDVSSITSGHFVHCYTPSQDKWTTLPELPVRYFGIAKAKGKLVAVGGFVRRKGDGRWAATNEVYVFEKEKIWQKSMPPMPTARYLPAVVSLPSHIIVAGGDLTAYDYTDIVEIYSISASQWSKADRLPYACGDPSVAVCNGVIHLLGGWVGMQSINRAVTAQVDRLISSSAPVDHQDSGRESAWKEIVNTPSYFPSSVSVLGVVLAFGGVANGDSKSMPQQKLHAYSSSIDSWVYVGDLPSPVAWPAAVSLSPSEFLVIGGQGENESVRMKTVYRATLSATLH